MNKKEWLILMEFLLIFLLITACFVIKARAKNFQRDCYISYDINETCPCHSDKLQPSFSSMFANITVGVNKQNNINHSIKNNIS